jgi:hypothetical protein
MRYEHKGKLFQRSKLVSSRHQLAIAPIAEGGMMESVHAAEQHMVKDGVPEVRVAGRELLATVSLGYNSGTKAAALLGERLTPNIPVTPNAFGGRLAYLSEGFDECELEAAHLTFVPVDPTTKPGAICIFYTPDNAQASSDTGSGALIDASSLETFAQTPIWKEISIPIHTQDALKRYFDEESSDFRFSVQGVVDVMAASDIPADATGTTPVGNLYMDYTYRFFSPHLIADVTPIYTTVQTATPRTAAVAVPEPFLAKMATAADATYWGITWTAGPVPVTELPGYMASVRVYWLDLQPRISQLARH